MELQTFGQLGYPGRLIAVEGLMVLENPRRSN